MTMILLDIYVDTLQTCLHVFSVHTFKYITNVQEIL